MHWPVGPRDEVHDSESRHSPCSQASAGEIRFLGERRLIRQARRVENAKLFAFLLVFKIRGHSRLFTFFQQVVVKIKGRLVTTRYFLELLFYHGASLNTCL